MYRGRLVANLIAIIAEEVSNLTFSYWDGSAWQDTWDGTQPGADGTTPMGPPVAIAITITLPSSASKIGDEASVKTYRHVVPIAAANGLLMQNGGTSFIQSTTGQ